MKKTVELSVELASKLLVTHEFTPAGRMECDGQICVYQRNEMGARCRYFLPDPPNQKLIAPRPHSDFCVLSGHETEAFSKAVEKWRDRLDEAINSALTDPTTVKYYEQEAVMLWALRALREDDPSAKMRVAIERIKRAGDGPAQQAKKEKEKSREP